MEARKLVTANEKLPLIAHNQCSVPAVTTASSDEDYVCMDTQAPITSTIPRGPAVESPSVLAFHK